MASARASRGRARPWLAGVLLVVCVLAGYLLSYNVDQPAHNGDWFIRYQVTCAIVEHDSFAIAPYVNDARTGPGLRHKTYAQYTPGQSVAMVPLYLLGRRLAGLPHTSCAAPVAPAVVLLTCKLLGPILGALLAALFYATARLLRYPRRTALGLAALLAFGTSLWPDVQSNLEHTMESLFLLAAAYAALRYTTESKVGSRESGVGREVSPTGTAGFQPAEASPTGTAGFQPANDRSRDARPHRHARGQRQAGWKPAVPVGTGRLWLVAMGLAAGLVFVTRVAGVIAIPIFALYLAALHLRRVGGRESGVGSETTTDSAAAPRERIYTPQSLSRLSTPDSRLFLRDLALYGAGVLPGVLVNMAYDAARFGSPLKTGPYPDQSFGFPPWLGLPDLLVSPGKGLLWYIPAVLLLALAARPFRRRHPLPALLFAIVCGVYLLFYANVNYWHGDPAWGPRYLYATLPYLILPLGEVFARWRGYRRPLRAALVGVLALSVLVQLSAVSVSYWRFSHYMFGYHHDQIDAHAWGYNLNYYWTPAQSPLLFSLRGVADVARDYADRAPLTQHPVGEHLGAGNESCIFPVYRRVAICLTDADQLRDRASLNTYTPWWLHTYPGWPPRSEAIVAATLLAVFLVGGAALLRLTRSTTRAAWAAPTRGAGVVPALVVPTGTTGVLPVPVAATVPATAGASARTSMPAGVGAYRHTPWRSRGATGPLAAAMLVAVLVYGTIAAAGAASAPRRAAPLVRAAAMGQTIADGDIAYRVLGVTSLHSVLDIQSARHALGSPARGQAAVSASAWSRAFSPGRGHAYAIVRVWLRNLSPRRRYSIRRTTFALADAGGHAMYRWPCPVSVLIGPHRRRPGAMPGAIGGLMGRPAAPPDDLQGFCPRPRRRFSVVDPAALVSELYHVPPAWYYLPPRSGAQRVLVYIVPASARRFALLGPGITLTRLDLVAAPAPARPTSLARELVVTTPLVLAMRRDPRPGAPIVEWLPQGAALRLDARRGDWVAVTTARGVRGYVPRRDVRPGR